VDGEITSHTQSGAWVKAGVFGKTGIRSRRQPAQSGTSTSSPKCSSGASSIHQPPKGPAMSTPITVPARACGEAGRGLTISSPSMISATLVSGTCIRSS
jgi:hypothetical protein